MEAEIARARAAVTLVNSRGITERQRSDMEIEAFMGLFHPELQKDRAYMRELKKSLRPGPASGPSEEYGTRRN